MIAATGSYVATVIVHRPFTLPATRALRGSGERDRAAEPTIAMIRRGGGDFFRELPDAPVVRRGGSSREKRAAPAAGVANGAYGGER